MTLTSPPDFPRIIYDAADREALFPEAYITSGVALDRALESLGLTLEEPKPRLRDRLATAAAYVVGFVGTVALSWGAVEFMLWALAANAPEVR